MPKSVVKNRTIKRPKDNTFAAATLTLANQYRRDIRGQMTDNRLEQSTHYRGVLYIAIQALMDAVYASSIQLNRKHRKFHATSLRRLEKGLDAIHSKALPTPHAQTEDEQFRPFDDPDHSLVKLIDRPNRTDTFNELLAQIVLQYHLTGSGLLWGNPNNFGVPAELYVLPTALCYPQPPTPDFPEGWWQVTSYYPTGGYGVLPATFYGGGAPVDARDIFVFKNPHPLWRWDAMSPLTACATQLDVLEAIDIARWTAMESGLTPDMVLLAPGVNQSNLDVYLERLKQSNMGKRNHRKVMAIGGDQGDSKFDVKWPSQSAKDMDFSSGWDQMTAFALAAFGVPKSVAGLATTGSYAELYAALKQFHTLKLRPLVSRLGVWLTKSLAHIWGDDLAIQLDLPTIDDQQLQETQLQTDLAHDGLTYNEYRSVRGRKPVPGGEVLCSVYVQNQQAKAQQALQASQQPPPSAAPPSDPNAAPAPDQAGGAQPPSPNAAAAPGQPDASAQPQPGDEQQSGDQLSALLGTPEQGSDDSHVQDAVSDAALGALGVPPTSAGTVQKSWEPQYEKAAMRKPRVSAAKNSTAPEVGSTPPKTPKIASEAGEQTRSPSPADTPKAEHDNPNGQQIVSGPSGKTFATNAAGGVSPAPAPQPTVEPPTAPPKSDLTPTKPAGMTGVKSVPSLGGASPAPTQAAPTEPASPAPQPGTPTASPNAPSQPRLKVATPIATPTPGQPLTGPFQHRQEGERWEGPSGHTFTLRNGRPVPAASTPAPPALNRAQITASIASHPDVKTLKPAQRLAFNQKLAKVTDDELLAHAKQLGVAHPDAHLNLSEQDIRNRVANVLGLSPAAVQSMRPDTLYSTAEQGGIIPQGYRPGGAAAPKGTSPNVPTVMPKEVRQQIISQIQQHPEVVSDPLTPAELNQLQTGPADQLVSYAQKLGIQPPTLPKIPTVQPKPESAIPVAPPIADKATIAATVNAGQLPPEEHFAPAAQALAPLVKSNPSVALSLARVNSWAMGKAEQHADQVAAHFGIDREKAIQLVKHAIVSVAKHAANATAQNNDGTYGAGKTLTQPNTGKTATIAISPKRGAALKLINELSAHVSAGHDLNKEQAAEAAHALEHMTPDDIKRHHNSLLPARTVSEHKAANRLAAAASKAVAASVAAGTAVGTALDSANAARPFAASTEQPQPAMVASAPVRPRAGAEGLPPGSSAGMPNFPAPPNAAAQQPARRPDDEAAQPATSASGTPVGESPSPNVVGDAQQPNSPNVRPNPAETDAIWSHAVSTAAPNMDKKSAKAFVESLPVPHALPDSPGDYFKLDEADKTVPLSQIKNLRARPEGIENAGRFMEASRRGIMPKRGPLNVVDNGDGTYTVADGNSTFANAKNNNWKSLPVKIVPLEELHKEQRKTIDKEHARAVAKLASDQVFTPEEMELPKKGVKSAHNTKEELYAAAHKEKPAFDKIIDAGEGVEKAIGATAANPANEAEFKEAIDTPGPVVLLGGIKGDKRATEKVNSDYKDENGIPQWNQLHDILRATVAVDTAAEIPQAMAALKKEVAAKGWKIVKQPKNRFQKPTLAGYSDYMLNIIGPGGVVSEVQVNLKSMVKAKELEAHKHYEAQRDVFTKMTSEGRDTATPEEAARIKQLVNTQRKIYGSAWLRSLGLHSGEGLADDVQLDHLNRTWEKLHEPSWKKDFEETGVKNEHVSDQGIPGSLRGRGEASENRSGQQTTEGVPERAVGDGVRPEQVPVERGTGVKAGVRSTPERKVTSMDNEKPSVEQVRAHIERLKKQREDFIRVGKSTTAIDKEISDWTASTGEK